MKNRNPLRTKNDRTRLKPLNLTQLEDLLTKSSRGRDKDKIQRRIKNLLSRWF